MYTEYHLWVRGSIKLPRAKDHLVYQLDQKVVWLDRIRVR